MVHQRRAGGIVHRMLFNELGASSIYMGRILIKN
jgi:hypothetical protein